MNITATRDRIFESIDELTLVTHVEGDATAGELLHAIVELGQLKDIVSDIESLLKTELCNMSKHGDVVTTDTHTTSIKTRPASTSTDWARALPAALEAIDNLRMFDADSGVVEDYVDAAARLLPELVPMTGSVKPKKSGAKRLDLDLESYVTVTAWGGLSVGKITPIAAQDGAAA